MLFHRLNCRFACLGLGHNFAAGVRLHQRDDPAADYLMIVGNYYSDFTFHLYLVSPDGHECPQTRTLR